MMRDKGGSPFDLVIAINLQEARLRQAILTGNVAELDALIAEELIFVGHLGQIITKEMDLDAYRSGKMRVDRLELSETEVRPMGEVVLVITRCSLAGSYDHEAFAGDFRYTRVWHRRDTGWQIVAGHCSAIA
jgi:ketosteroid isomerase-like protein